MTDISTRSYRSIWQSAWFVRMVAVVRRVLRPFVGAEDRFIEWLARHQNSSVRRHLGSHPAGKVLMIMPRCVKKTGCRADVQKSLEECLYCMRCPLGDVAQSCEKFQVKALVAFRSHIAFEMARTEKPDLIVASACHDRMIKALRSVPEVPSLLAPLTGMDKMCVNATIDLPWLEEQLAALSGTAPAPSCPAGTPFPRPIPADLAEHS